MPNEEIPKDVILSEEKEKDNKKSKPLTWNHEEDNCGINPDENPCGDANEY